MNARTVRRAVFVVLGCSIGCDVVGAPDARGPASAAGDAPRSDHGFPGGAPKRGAGPMGQRWVLRDARGAAIDAVVEPTCGGGVACVINEPGTQGVLAPPCVRILWLGDSYVDLRYSMSTGLASDCAAHRSELTEIGYFLAPDCSGGLFHSPGNGVEEAARWSRRAYHIEETGLTYFESNHIELVQNYYTWYGGRCVAFEHELFETVEWRPLPDELIALGGAAPYGLAWE